MHEAEQCHSFVTNRQQKEQTPSLTYRIMYFMYLFMTLTISSTDAVRGFGDCIARVKHRGDTFLITKNNRAVAKLVPAGEAGANTTGRLFELLRQLPPADPGFANDLEQANSKEMPSTPWAS